LAENKYILGPEEIEGITSRKALRTHLKSADVNLSKINYVNRYERELELLQIELVKLQHWVHKQKKRVVIIFEGRDAAGKGGTIRRFTEHLNPRSMRVVALAKPSEIERGQWYFMRYIKELPGPGEIVFFDRSWYNRGVVEPVMGFCSQYDYKKFLMQVPEFEHMLYEDGIVVIKFWFSISNKEQLKRFESRKTNPLKQWKLSPVDEKSRSKWDLYTKYIDRMLAKTHTAYCPWNVVNGNNKNAMRLESMRHVLNLFEYPGKSEKDVYLYPDPNVVQRYFRAISK